MDYNMEIQVQKREKFGKQTASLRRENLIPAELYGHGIENLHLVVSKKDFLKVFKKAGENTVLDLLIDNEKRPVLIYNVSSSPLTDEILNVDFYQVRLDQKIQLEIALNFLGEAPGVNLGGILVKALQEVEVETSPLNIPSAFDVDLTKLVKIGDAIYVKDLKVSEGVKILIDPETVVATLTEPVSEEKEAELSQEVDVSKIKVEAEEKKEKPATEEIV